MLSTALWVIVAPLGSFVPNTYYLCPLGAGGENHAYVISITSVTVRYLIVP